MSIRRTAGAPFGWIAAVAVLVTAAPAWSQTPAREVRRDSVPQDSAQQKTKIDALTMKQKTTAGADVFLKIEGIKGEASGNPSSDRIAILSWHWGESPAQARSRPRSGRGTLTITKTMDRNSPRLMEAAAKGQMITRLTLTLPPRPGEPARTVTLENVTVASVQRSSDVVPTETLSLNFEEIK